MLRLRWNVHTPEVIQGCEGFNSGFPQAAGLLFPDPYDTKSSCLLGKLAREDTISPRLQRARGSDQCTERTDYARMRGFFNHASIARGAPYLHGDTHDHTPAHPGSRQVFAIVLTWVLPGVYSPLDSLMRSM
jgi:hypothetical protein